MSLAVSFQIIILEEKVPDPSLFVPVCSIQYFTINSPLVQNVPEESSVSDPEVNVFCTTPIKRIPNERTAETSTGTIAS